jgi:cell division FtsZ-interacting protein ZapD
MSFRCELAMEQAGSTAKQYFHQASEIIKALPRGHYETEIAALIHAQALDYLAERLADKIEQHTQAINALTAHLENEHSDH